MNVTEILITGYDGDSAVFATSLAPGRAKTVFTAEDADGQSAVDSVLDVATPAFGQLVQMLKDLKVLSRSEFAAAAK